MVINIRKARNKDITEIVNLNQQLFEHEKNKGFDDTLNCTWPLKNKSYFKQSISNKNRVCFVAIENQEVVGYIIGSINNAEDYRNIKKIAEADNMFILSKYRNQGLGSLLIKEVIKWAKLKKAKRIRVVISANNIQSIKFHKKVGFKDYNITLEQEI